MVEGSACVVPSRWDMDILGVCAERGKEGMYLEEGVGRYLKGRILIGDKGEKRSHV